MGFLDDMRELADGVRAISETTIPIRTTQVIVRTRVWPQRIKQPNTSPRDYDLVMPLRYLVRYLTSKEIAASGGRYTTEDVRWGPITPLYAGTSGSGGYSIAQLNPAADTHTEILYMLSGGITGEYRLDNIDTAKPFRYMLTLIRNRPTP